MGIFRKTYEGQLLDVSRKKILIIGGGFGGVKAAIELQQHDLFDITVISDQPHFEYHAALYRSATGWSPSEVVLPIVDIFDEDSTVVFKQAKIDKISSTNKIVIDKEGNKYKFDKLIIAVGQIKNYFGLKNIEDKSYGMNTIEDALKLRQHLRDTVTKSNSEQWELEFAVIGGGATGTELASELKFFIDELCRLHKVKRKKTHVTLIEAGPRLLPIMSPKASKFAEWRLKQLGVRVLLQTSVKDYKNNQLILSDGKLKTGSVIWTAGALNNKLFASNSKEFKISRNGKVQVDEYLQASKNIFVLGDNADTQYSGMAQTALFDGEFVANNIVREHHKKK